MTIRSSHHAFLTGCRAMLLACVLVLLASPLPASAQSTPEPASVPPPAPTSRLAALYTTSDGSLLFQTNALTSTERSYSIMRQGNDSNCEYIAVRNGIANTGGDGDQAYWSARELVPQLPRDFRESYYTLLGPSGSDQPFTPDNLGAAPEAFVGVYEALGYNAVSMATTPGRADGDFAQAIYRRLADDPHGSFAHIWITAQSFNPRSRTLVVEETGEHVDLPFPYHEVVALAAPDQPGHVIILDGLVGHPFTMSLDELARQMHGFNRVIVASHSEDSLEAHQWFQLRQVGMPYVDHPLGGIYLRTARQLWGNGYTTWGTVIAPPFRALDGDGTTEKVSLFGEYVQYDRLDATTVNLAPLGVRMAQDLERSEVITREAIFFAGGPKLSAGQREWVAGQFGSVEDFQRIFGPPITAEFVITAEALRTTVLRGAAHPLVPEAAQHPYIATLTERTMILWSADTGFFLAPLGRTYYDKVKADLVASG